MASLMCRVAALYLQLAYRPRMATAEAARTRLLQPKTDPAPPTRLAARHRVSTHTVGGFTVHTVQPRTPAAATGTRPVVLYLHGGAYLAEIVREHWRLISRMADAGCEVVVPLYGLAPQHTYRDAFPFLTAVYQQIVARVNPDTVTVAGDSAGGGLALALTQTLRTPPGRLVLISPWLDLTMSNPAVAAVRPLDPWLSPPGLVVAGQAWAGGDDPHRPELSPLNGDLSALPPTDLYIGTRDVFHPDTILLHELARKADVDCTLQVADGAFHVYPLVTIVPEGRRAAADIVRRITGGHPS
ncbi:alpha/beta hydrolase [Actinoplanes rectilineatus]|uniref:alpha/beta hydrolase n=1 Tax=Actinoplanes rectilineatus TaxID=113571 RepID=UPI0005F29DA7|nr:alpha/beta hydrolase [Actinoplanes rectilineatus]